MKKKGIVVGLVLGLLVFSAFQMHKFYVSVTQIDFAEDKKAIQITTRIFIDDLNNALEQKHKKIFYLGSSKETPEQTGQLKQYLAENIFIKVNGKSREIVFLEKEMEDDVLVCYLIIRNTPKVTSLEIKNTLLFNFLPEQQHIIHTRVSGKKRSALLTSENREELLKY